MAKLYGSNATLRDVNVPSTKIVGVDVNARIKVSYDEYVLPAATDFGATDTITLMKIPAGARIKSATIVCDAMGGSCAGSLGWLASGDAVEAAQATGLISGASLASAARVNMAAEVGAGKKFLSEVQVQFALSAVSSSAGGKKIRVWVEYAAE